MGWKEALPIGLIHTHIVPKKQVGLSLYKTFCLCQLPLP